MAFPPLVSFSALDNILTVVIVITVFITHEMSHKACSREAQGMECELLPCDQFEMLRSFGPKWEI